MRRISCVLLVTLMLVGCGVQTDVPAPAPSKKAPSESTKVAPSSEGQPFVLDAEPSGAAGVLEVRKKAKDGDEVVVIGQVGGTAAPFTEGRASFLIVDPSLKPTEECESPWDFCEYPKKEVAAARMMVKFVDAGGKTLAKDARELFGVKELSEVVVQGQVKRDDKENFVVVARKIHVRRR